MAKYNEILVGRFNRFLQKLTQIKGTAPAPQLAGEIMPVIPLFVGNENRYLDGWDSFQIWQQQPAVAANSNALQMRNPTGSNMIAVVEKIFLTLLNAEAADQFVLTGGPGIADLATIDTVGTNSRLDARSLRNPTLIFSRSGASVGGSGVTKMQIALAVNASWDMVGGKESEEIPLLPGDTLRISNVTVNQTTQVTWKWRERFLEESERA